MNKKSHWGSFLFFIVSPVLWVSDILFNKEQFRVKVSGMNFTSRMDYLTARKMSKAYGGSIYWRRRKRWKRVAVGE